MAQKFTPGNWKIGNYSSCVVTDDKQSIDLEKRDTPDSVKYYGGALICESCRENDAKIIAASKDLLEALQELLNLDSKEVDIKKRIDAESKAKKAIKKATE